jgi:hypothetical protein
MQPAATRGLNKGLRSLLQTIAGGGITALIAAIAGGLNPTLGGLLIAAFGALVAYLQNYFETKGTIPTILPTPGLVTTTTGGLITKAVGTADTAVSAAGDVTADVIDTAGKTVGGVVGATTGLVKDVENLGGI